MDGKEVKCSCKVVYSKILLIGGIVGGLLLAVLGIVTITADTTNLFGAPFVHWYKYDVRKISFTDTRGFSVTEWWNRPQDYLFWEWDLPNLRTSVVECDSNFEKILATGLKTDCLTVGREYMPLANMTISTHYFCRSDDCGHSCRPEANYRCKVHMYTGTLFYTNGYLGNQNMRFTFFILAVLIVAFGVIMILGELHLPIVTTKFTFFYYSFVKGLIYVGIGFLVMGMANILGLVVAIYFWILGILNCIYGWRSVTNFKWNKIRERGTTTVVTRREYI